MTIFKIFLSTSQVNLSKNVVCGKPASPFLVGHFILYVQNPLVHRGQFVSGCEPTVDEAQRTLFGSLPSHRNLGNLWKAVCHLP